MKRNIILLAMLSVLLSLTAAQAKMIDVMEIRQSIDVSTIGTVDHFDFYFLQDNRLHLSTAPLNTIEKLTMVDCFPLIAMLQRTLVYTPEDRMGDMPLAESISFYETGVLRGLIQISGTENFTEGGWSLPLPDLSGFRIDALYAEKSMVVAGDIADCDVRIYADAIPIPEPSTILLIAVSATVWAFTYRRRVKQ